LFPLETPLRLSRNILHEWKDNSMLAKSTFETYYHGKDGFVEKVSFIFIFIHHTMVEKILCNKLT